MEQLAFRIEKERRYGQFISLGGYENSRRIFGNRAIYAVSVNSGEFISGKTKKENGKVIIKKENIDPNDLIIVFHSGDYWAIHFYRVEDLLAYATAWPIDKKKAQDMQFKKEIAA